MMALGRIYEQGLGTKIDIATAFKYYNDAAAENMPYALYWLGYICETG